MAGGGLPHRPNNLTESNFTNDTPTDDEQEDANAQCFGSDPVTVERGQRAGQVRLSQRAASDGIQDQQGTEEHQTQTEEPFIKRFHYSTFCNTTPGIGADAFKLTPNEDFRIVPKLGSASIRQCHKE